MRVDVVVRTKKVGHFFPGGTVDAYDTWLELKGTDDKGQTDLLERHGGRRRQRPGRKGRALLSLAAGGCTWQSDQQAQCLVHARRRLCALDSARRRRHRSLPLAYSRNAGNKITLHARLCYRKFAWWNTQFSFAGNARSDQPSERKSLLITTTASSPSRRSLKGVSAKQEKIPDVPIVAVAEDEVHVASAPHNAPAAPANSRSCKLTTGSAGTITASDCSCKAI